MKVPLSLYIEPFQKNESHTVALEVEELSPFTVKFKITTLSQPTEFVNVLVIVPLSV